MAPSGIDALPIVEQAAVFTSIYAGLGATTLASLTSVAALSRFELFRQWQRSWFVLGLIFALVGVTHFTAEEGYVSIFPPIGTWGLWFLPGSPKFHVRWTGAAEVLGGLGLLVGGVAAELAPESKVAKLRGVSAAALAGLVLAVTPANIYMYTHGAEMVGLGPPGPLPVTFHYVRFVLQVALLTILGDLARKEL